PRKPGLSGTEAGWPDRGSSRPATDRLRAASTVKASLLRFGEISPRLLGGWHRQGRGNRLSGSDGDRLRLRPPRSRRAVGLSEMRPLRIGPTPRVSRTLTDGRAATDVREVLATIRIREAPAKKRMYAQLSGLHSQLLDDGVGMRLEKLPPEYAKRLSDL